MRECDGVDEGGVCCMSEPTLPLLQHFSNPVPHCICLHMYFFFPVPLKNVV